MGIRVLSLFDGISCARVALAKSNIKVDEYFASEIDQKAISISQRNWPDIKHIGDVLKVKATMETLGSIDLLIGGPPCQDLSIAKRDREGLAGARSSLFYVYADILHRLKPKYFIMENVASMPKEAKEEISAVLGVQPIMIDAALVSAQSRKRLFWTNIPDVEQPADCLVVLQDILLPGAYTERYKSYCVPASEQKGTLREHLTKAKRTHVFSKPIKVSYLNNKDSQGNRIYSIGGKSVTLSALGGGLGAKTGLYETLKGYARKLHPIECERLQGLPDNYTEGESDNVRYRCLGNAFNADVVAHILKGVGEEWKK